MQLSTLSIIVASLLAVCYAAPANNHALVRRQTYIITCIGGKCQGPEPTPTPTPKPTSSSIKKPDPPKTSSSSVYTPPPVYPSKTTKPTPPKSTLQPSKTGGGEGGPSSTACPVPLYYQCGGYYDGKPWTGCTKCVKGAKCVVQNEFYDQCVAEDSTIEEEEA